MYGGRISLAVGFIATAVALVIGVTWGAIAGYVGGRVDAVVCSNDGMAGGVAAALAGAGRSGIPVSGQDGDQAALARIPAHDEAAVRRHPPK